MPVPPILVPVLEGVAVDAVRRAGQAVLTRLPWSRDAKRVEVVNRLQDELTVRVTQLAAHLPDGQLDAALDEQIRRFTQDVVATGAKPNEAAELAQAVRGRLLALVVEPARHRGQVNLWLREIEGDLKRLPDLERRLEKAETASATLAARTVVLTSLLGASLALALAALLVALLAGR